MRKEKLKELKSYIDELKLVNKKKIEGNRFLQVERYNCLINNGEIINREKLLKSNSKGNASIVLPITKNNTTILVVQPRVFTKSTVGISCPAGYVEDDEDYIVAAQRELLEETGYKSNKMIEVCSFYQDDGISSAFNKGFVALDCFKYSPQNLDESEFIRYFECNIDELFELLEKGYILDGGSQLLIEKSKRYLKRRG